MSLTIHTINLARREDRWKRMEDIGREHNWLNIVRQPAVDLPTHPWIGCTIGHLLAVYDAKIRQDPMVLVAEDDWRPTKYFDQLLALIELADASEYGILYTGSVSYPNDIVSDDGHAIVETDTILSSQLVCVFARAYDAFLSLKFGCGSDWNRDPAIPGEHQERMANTYPKIKRGLCVPFLTTQFSDYSDSCKRVVNMEAQWKDAEEAWFRARALNTNRSGP